MSGEAWVFLGTTVTALATVIVALIQNRRRDGAVRKAAEQAHTSATQAYTSATSLAVELSPNGGKSLRDQINRMDTTQQQILDQQAKQWRESRRQGERLARVEGAIETMQRQK